jgi:hypothetical protein
MFLSPLRFSLTVIPSQGYQRVGRAGTVMMMGKVMISGLMNLYYGIPAVQMIDAV